MADDSGEIAREAAEAVGFTNIKTIGEASSFYAQMGMANAISNQNAQNVLQLSVLSKATEKVMETTPEEGASSTALAQILAKLAGNTPPVTP